jgi:hypothetical protein
MTAAQRDYLASRGIDPWSLTWSDAHALGFLSWGQSEAAVLPDGQVLLANGTRAERPVPEAPR